MDIASDNKSKLFGVMRVGNGPIFSYVREENQLIITRIDRLARSTLHLCHFAETLGDQGVDLVVLDQNIDTSDATGRLLFNRLGAIGQFETEIRADGQMDGIKKAKDRGVSFGKRPALTNEQIAELREKRSQGTPIKDHMAYSASPRPPSTVISLKTRPELEYIILIRA